MSMKRVFENVKEIQHSQGVWKSDVLGTEDPKVKKFSEELQWLSFGELREKVRLINYVFY